MFVTHRTQACRIQHEVSAALRGLEPEPSRSQHAHEVSTRKNQHISLHRAHTAYHALRARVDLDRRFTSRTAVPKQLPVWPFLANLGSGATFILTVVPFD